MKIVYTLYNGLVKTKVLLIENLGNEFLLMKIKQDTITTTTNLIEHGSITWFR